jgi:hypothetical protein
MLKWWIYVLIGVFLIDLIYRSFFQKRITLKSMRTKNISNVDKFNENVQNISETKKNKVSKYDKKKFDPEIIHFYNKDNSKIIQNGKELEDEEDDIVYPNNSKEVVIIDEDEIEFEGLIPKPQKRINITIEYDEKYQNLFDELTKQLEGNITYLEFYPKLVTNDGDKKIIKYFLYFSLCIFCLCFAFIEKIMNSCCNFIPQGLQKFISIIKYLLSGGSYLIHMYFIKKISHSNKFEVYVEQQLKYSTIKRETPPTYIILFNIIKNFKNN